MKKLLLSFLAILFLLVLVGCGSLTAPTDFKIENDKLSFSTIDGASYQCEVKKDGVVIKTATVKNGDSVDILELGIGSFELRVKATKDGQASDWSNVATYEMTKLATPQGVEIKNNKLYFNNVNGADSYRAIFVRDGKEVTKNVVNGSLLTNLGLEAGTYDVYVIADMKNAASDVASNRSEKVVYTLSLEELDVPTGLSIEDEYVFFDVMGSIDTYVLKFESDKGVFEREIESSGQAINELLIPEGIYKVSIKAKGDGLVYSDSQYSEPINYTKVMSFMELKEKDLINGGYIKWMGRTYYNEDKKVNEVYHSASGFELFFKGTTVVAQITATNYNNPAQRPCIVIVIDDDFDHAKTLFLDKATQEVTLITNNADLEEHKIDLYKRSESIDSHIAVASINTDGVFIKKIVNKELKLEFIAASSSTGYGNLGSPSSPGKTTENSDCLKGFAFLTAQALNADVNIFSASGWGCAFSKWTTPNTANVPDEYMNVDFNSKVPWVHGLYVPDVVVVNLGTNDWSYINAATNDTERDARMTTFQKKYIAFLKFLHDTYPDAQIIVLYGLMNESSIYDITEQIVKTAKLAIPDLAIIKINGDAGGYNSHPSAASHKVIANTLTNFIKELLDK